jgi:hypothetical protein
MGLTSEVGGKMLDLTTETSFQLADSLAHGSKRLKGNIFAYLNSLRHITYASKTNEELQAERRLLCVQYGILLAMKPEFHAIVNQFAQENSVGFSAQAHNTIVDNNLGQPFQGLKLQCDVSRKKRLNKTTRITYNSNQLSDWLIQHQLDVAVLNVVRKWIPEQFIVADYARPVNQVLCPKSA